MKHLSEYRDAEAMRRIADHIGRLVTRRWAIMEVCGGQTHSIIRSGLDQILPPEVELIHGPGCPVCVTALETIDQALGIAALPGMIFCSYGDMLRVPGSRGDLLGVRAAGADVRIVASPLDAVALARQYPEREVVFFAVGFETTAPASAMAVRLAAQSGLGNFSMLVSHVLVPPAIRVVMESSGNRVQAFLAAGHVASVMGTGDYPPLCREFRVPIVVTGLLPLDILEGIRRTVVQLEEGRHDVENAYPRVVSEGGNARALAVIGEVFEVCDRTWRGIGPIPASGWRLAPAYASFDALSRFSIDAVCSGESLRCRSGDVLTGAIKPHQCPAFGRECTPRTPLGATMVSDEGACAAYYHAGRSADGLTAGRQQG